MKKNAFYAQSGGVTSVINATAAALILESKKYQSKIGKVFAGKNGILGALNEELFDTSKETLATIKSLKKTPGGAFGSCRIKLKSFEENKKDIENADFILCTGFLDGHENSLEYYKNLLKKRGH